MECILSDLERIDDVCHRFYSDEGLLRPAGFLDEGVYGSVHKVNSDSIAKVIPLCTRGHYLGKDHLTMPIAAVYKEGIITVDRMPKTGKPVSLHLKREDYFLSVIYTTAREVMTMQYIDIRRCDYRNAARVTPRHVANFLAFGGEHLYWVIVQKRRYGQKIRSGLPLVDVAHVAMQGVMALEDYERIGVIHGDIKPDNILLSRGSKKRKGKVSIVDFGTSSIPEDVTSNHKLRPLFSDPYVMGASCKRARGTPCYMSPEQAMGDEYNPATDRFSFGLTLARTLTPEEFFPPHLATSAAVIRQIALNTSDVTDMVLRRLRATKTPVMLIEGIESILHEDPSKRDFCLLKQAASDILHSDGYNNNGIFEG